MTVDTAGVHVAEDAVVYQVQQTALQTFALGDNGTFEADSITYATPAGMPTLSFRRGFQFPAAVAPLTIAELGFGWWPAAASIWSRVVLPGGGDAVAVGQIYEVEYLLTLQLPGGQAPVAVGDTSGGTWDTSGTYMLESASDAIDQAIDLNYLGAALDPVANPNHDGIRLITAPYAQRALCANVPFLDPPYSNVVDRDHLSQAAYVAGSFHVVRTSVFDVASAVTTIYGISGRGNAGSAWDILLTVPIAKDALHTLTFIHTVSWGRILTN